MRGLGPTARRLRALRSGAWRGRRENPAGVTNTKMSSDRMVGAHFRCRRLRLEEEPHVRVGPHRPEAPRALKRRRAAAQTPAESVECIETGRRAPGIRLAPTFRLSPVVRRGDGG